MDEKTAKEFYEQLKGSCDLLGRAMGTKVSPEDIMKTGLTAYPTLPMPGGPKKVPKHFEKSLEKGGILAAFQALPEPDEEEKSRWLTVLGDFPFLIRRAFQHAGKALPHKPGGAPRKLTTRKQEREACEALGRLLSLGVEKPDAISQVARRYKVSTKTIRRAWNRYRKSMAQSEC